MLGYSDGLFLLALPYIAGRIAGMDPYLAFEAALIVFKAVGFFSMVWLLRSYIGVSRPIALLGSVLSPYLTCMLFRSDTDNLRRYVLSRYLYVPAAGVGTSVTGS